MGAIKSKITFTFDKWFDAPNWHNDFVKVIRCKDCVYYRPYSDGKYDCDNMLGMADAYEDGFCSRAERKTK